MNPILLPAVLAFALASSPVAPRAAIAPPAIGHAAGIGSWGQGWTNAVTRLPRGTRICVTGTRGSWCGRSTGYGPSKATGRIVDLSTIVFTRICGLLSQGLCEVTLEWQNR